MNYPTSVLNLHPARPGAAAASLCHKHRDTLNFLVPLSGDYPGIDLWFQHKVVPGERLGTRYVFRVERNGRLAALGIAKNELGEKKICTVRVHPSYFGSGLGIRVFDNLLHWLQTDRPHLTVSEAKLPLFQRIFDYYGFEQTSATPDLYQNGSIEFGYNEIGSCRLPMSSMN